MPLVTQKVDLKDSFPYTNLDLQDSGPINVPLNKHKQNFTPSNKFKDSEEGGKGKGKLWNDSTQTGVGFDGPENLDIETDPKTFFPKSPSGKQKAGFKQQWGPEANEYANADLGEDGVGLYNEDNSLKGNLDVENNSPLPAPKNSKQKFGFTPKWSPSTEYTQNAQGQKQGGNLDPQAFEGPENLDIETNPKTSFPKSGKQKFGFVQQWGPNANEYQGADLGDNGVGLYNVDNSLKGNLDVENNPPIPASTGKNGGTFIQRYSSNGQFINSPEGDLSSDKLENKLNKPTAADSLNNTLPQSNLPSNKEMGFVQRYSSANEYKNTPQGQLRSNNSPAEQNNFRTSALDLESTSAGVKQGGSGGPINVSYTSKVGSETMSKTTTQPYTPQQTYRDFWQSKGGIDLNNLTDSYK